MLGTPGFRVRRTRLRVTNGGIQSVGNGPPVTKTVGQCVAPDTPLFRGYDERHRTKGSVHNTRGSPIQTLLRSASPPAIIRGITTRVVYALDGGILRPLAHICKKIFKSSPPVANGNASAPIIGEGWVLRVFAAITHGAPRPPRRSVFHTVPCVFASLLRHFFFMQTTTTTHTTPLIRAQDVLTKNKFLSAAVAPHPPPSTVFAENG